jgi:hypothetical protein
LLVRLAPHPRARFADYRLTELSYDYTFTGKDFEGVERSCSGTLQHESAGNSTGLYVTLISTQVTPPNYYSLAIRGNVKVCEGFSIGRTVWPDDLDSVLTDRTYTYTMDLVGSATNPSNGLPWSWNLKPV